MKRVLILTALGFSVAVLSCLVGRSSPAHSRSATPTILYALWIGKSLRVEGKDFSDGARVLVDGQELKTSNDENSPGLFLLAKKAKKKVARDQVITLQVRNPDGELSNAFTFFSGFVIGTAYNGIVLRLNIGDRFLLYLPAGGEPPTLQWGVGLGGTDQSSLTVLTRSMDNLPIPHAQGFFEVAHPGNVTLDAQAEPVCPPLPPLICQVSGANFGRFSMVVIVE